MDLQTDLSGTDRLARAVAGIAGLMPLDDGGELAGSIVERGTAFAFGCPDVDAVIEAAEAGKIGCIDTDTWLLSVAPVGNGTYLCNTDGWGEWIASSIIVARAWLTTGVGEGILMDSPSSTD